MDVLTIGIAVIVIVILNLVGMWYLSTRKGQGADAAPSQDGMMLLQKQVQDLAATLDRKVTESSKDVRDTVERQLQNSQNLIKEITQEVTSVKEIGRQTQGFAEQLKSLQDILKNPKQRGILGEYYLETTLKNVLPPDGYQMQYGFKNGEIVDAAVFVNGKVVPVDSKFSLENYNRLIKAEASERAALEKTFVNDLKMRITETAKYIRPEEGTLDFAFMFIPSEGIYYDLLTNQVGAAEDENLLHRAAAKYKVIIVSPTSFLAYLQTVLVGLNALKIEEKAAEIQKRVGELGKHIGAFDTFYQKLGNSLTTTVSHFNSGYKELGKIDKDVYRIAESKAGIEVMALDKPSMEDET